MTVKSREETRANREGTSKAGKGPLKHHEENREGPGQKKREAQRASRAMRKHGRAVGKQERPMRPEAAEAAKQGRTGKEPAGLGKGQGGKAMDHGWGRSREEAGENGEGSSKNRKGPGNY